MRFHFMRENILMLLCCLLLGIPCSAESGGAENASAILKKGSISIPLHYVHDDESLRAIEGPGMQFAGMALRPDEKPVAEPRYASKRPMYSVFLLGPEKKTRLRAVIDESRGTGSGYDTLYLDANHNLDFTDDPRYMANPCEEGKDWAFTFPVVELNVAWGDRVLPQHVRFTTNRYGEPNLQFTNTCAYVGELSWGSKKLAIALADFNGNGVWGDTALPGNDYYRDPLQVEGDRICLDLNQDGKFENRNGQFEMFPFGHYFIAGGACYETNVRFPEPALLLTRSSVKCGTVILGDAVVNAVLINGDGGICLTEKKTCIPEGTYQLYQTILETRDQEGVCWRALGRGGKQLPVINISRHQDTTLLAGNPLTAEVTMDRNPIKTFRLTIRGAGGETYEYDKIAPIGKAETLNEARLHLFDKSKKEIFNTPLNRGCGNNLLLNWDNPENLTGEFEAVPEMYVGPFPITVMTKKFTLE